MQEKTAKKTSSAALLLGDLLVKSELVTRQVLADAMPISLKTGLPVGRILIGSGALKETTMQAVLFAQSLVRDRLLDEELACKAIRMVDSEGITWDDALKSLGWKSESYELTNRLGELFLEAGCISDSQLNSGLEAFFSTGLPLARVLVLQGVITPSLAFAALTAQKLVRDDSISRPQAIAALRSAMVNNASLEDSLGYHGVVGPEPINIIRLGELLALANVVTEIDLIEGVERSMKNSEFIGETMVKTGHLPKYILDSALELQTLATQGEIEPSAAAAALRRIYTTGISLGEALQEIAKPAQARRKLLGLDEDGNENVSLGKAPKKRLTAEIPMAVAAFKKEKEEFIPAEELAVILGISLKAVTKRLKKGTLEGHQKNGKWFGKLPGIDDVEIDDDAESSELELTKKKNEKNADTLESGAQSRTNESSKDGKKKSSPGDSKSTTTNATANDHDVHSAMQARASELIEGIWNKRKPLNSASGDEEVFEILSHLKTSSKHSAAGKIDNTNNSSSRSSSSASPDLSSRPNSELMDLGRILANEKLNQGKQIQKQSDERTGKSTANQGGKPADAESNSSLQYNIPYGYELDGFGNLIPRKRKKTKRTTFKLPFSRARRKAARAASMGQTKLVETLLERIENLSYRIGYLEGKLDALSLAVKPQELQPPPVVPNAHTQPTKPKNKLQAVEFEVAEESEWVD